MKQLFLELNFSSDNLSCRVNFSWDKFARGVKLFLVEWTFYLNKNCRGRNISGGFVWADSLVAWVFAKWNFLVTQLFISSKLFSEQNYLLHNFSRLNFFSWRKRQTCVFKSVFCRNKLLSNKLSSSKLLARELSCRTKTVLSRSLSGSDPPFRINFFVTNWTSRINFSSPK